MLNLNKVFIKFITSHVFLRNLLDVNQNIIDNIRAKMTIENGHMVSI